MPHRSTRQSLTTFLIVGLLSAAAVATADTSTLRETRTVLILPFGIHAGEDLAFLQRGVGRMLASRLAVPNAVRVLPAETARTVLDSREAPDAPVSAAAARELAAAAGADFVVFGSITKLGARISTDAQCVAAENGAVVVSFGEASERIDDVIGHVDRFAARVRTEAFGLAAAPSPRSEAAPQQTPTRADPDTIWRQSRARQPADGGPPAPGAVWRSRGMQTVINGLAVADVDGDGRNEIAVTDAGNVLVFRLDRGRFQKLAEHAAGGFNRHLAVDAADINANGRAEIFVTNLLKSTDDLAGYVLEFDGRRLVRIAEDIPFYMRLTAAPGDGAPLLAGQRRSAGGRGFDSRIFRLAWQDGRYVPAETLRLPQVESLFAGARFVPEPGRPPLTAAFTAKERLKVWDDAGRALWAGDETYGGSLVDVNMFRRSPGDSDEVPASYIPLRLLPVDIGGEGRTEIVTARNFTTFGRLLSRTRLFTNGRVEILAWDGSRLTTVHRSQEFPKAIADLAVADIDGDGRRELVVAVVDKYGGLLDSPRSFIAALPLPALGSPAAPVP